MIQALERKPAYFFFVFSTFSIFHVFSYQELLAFLCFLLISLSKGCFPFTFYGCYFSALCVHHTHQVHLSFNHHVNRSVWDQLRAKQLSERLRALASTDETKPPARFILRQWVAWWIHCWMGVQPKFEQNWYIWEFMSIASSL